VRKTHAQNGERIPPPGRTTLPLLATAAFLKAFAADL
jgi:hypothetical protein